ncbi:MAG: hypothetical protein WD489_06610, partial [Rhodovibrionaceae bacterium]
PLGPVLGHQDDALAALQTHAAQRQRQPAHAIVDLAPAQRSVVSVTFFPEKGRVGADLGLAEKDLRQAAFGCVVDLQRGLPVSFGRGFLSGAHAAAHSFIGPAPSADYIPWFKGAAKTCRIQPRPSARSRTKTWENCLNGICRISIPGRIRRSWPPI